MKSSRALLNRIQTTCIVSFSLAFPQIWFQIHLRLLESLSRYIVCTRTPANCQRLYHLCIIQLFSIDYVKCAMLYFFCLKKNLFLYVTNENKRYKTFWSYHKTIKGILPNLLKFSRMRGKLYVWRKNCNIQNCLFLFSDLFQWCILIASVSFL